MITIMSLLLLTRTKEEKKNKKVFYKFQIMAVSLMAVAEIALRIRSCDFEAK